MFIIFYMTLLLKMGRQLYFVIPKDHTPKRNRKNKTSVFQQQSITISQIHYNSSIHLNASVPLTN